MQRNGWQDIPVLAVETEGTASLHAALQAGHPVELAAVYGVATSLGARRVCDQALTWAHSHPLHALQVSDPAALGACEQLLADHRVLVEPACGAALSVVYDGNPVLNAYSKLAIIICGGATTTIDQIRQWAAAS